MNYIPALHEDTPRRIVTANDIIGPNGIPVQMLLSGMKWSDPVTETPKVGSTEDWNRINGPLPLTQPPITIPIEPYLIGEELPPKENEIGWKDTVVTNPGQVTRIRVRIAPQDVAEGLSEPGENYFSFDPSSGIGYVWHCHLLDHEDNEMMRPMNIIK